MKTSGLYIAWTEAYIESSLKHYENMFFSLSFVLVEFCEFNSHFTFCL